MLYVEKRGTLNVGLRLEWLMARQHVAFINANTAKGKQATLREHLRYHDTAHAAPDEPKRELTVAEKARMFATQTSQPARKVTHG